MKKVALLLVLVLSLFFVSCSQEPDPKSDLIGKWKSGLRYMTIKDDGSFIMDNPAATQLGKWSENNGTLLMIFNDDPSWHWVDAPYTLNDGVLSFTDSNNTNWNWVKQ